MIIASHCFYVQRCRTSYLNPSFDSSSMEREHMVLVSFFINVASDPRYWILSLHVHITIVQEGFATRGIFTMRWC